MDGIFVAAGPAFRHDAKRIKANLLDIAPTVLHLLGVAVPSDMDGRILTELLDPEAMHASASPVFATVFAGANEPDELPVASTYAAEDDAAIKQRLADLGYL